jgi:serine/threonine protein kinase
MRAGAMSIDRYEFLSLLGRGAFGEVHRVRHRYTGRELALKLVDPESNDELRQRTLNEARIAAQVRHPGVIEVFDSGVLPDGRVFIAMELAEGESLAALLDRERVLDPRRAVALGAQLLDALSCVHARGVVHRDLKPANVIVTRGADGFERARIVDFGIGKASASVVGTSALAGTRAGALLGTPGYMPPEQFDARSADNRADLFSVGAILYRALSGREAFLAEDFGAWVRALALGPAPALSSIAPWIDPRLGAVIDTALERERDRRWPDASRMLAALLSAPSAPVAPIGAGPSLSSAQGRPLSTMAGAPTVARPYSAMSERGAVPAPSMDVGAVSTPATRSRSSSVSPLSIVLSVAGVTSLAASVALAFALRAPREDELSAVNDSPAPAARSANPLPNVLTASPPPAASIMAAPSGFAPSRATVPELVRPVPAPASAPAPSVAPSRGLRPVVLSFGVVGQSRTDLLEDLLSTRMQRLERCNPEGRPLAVRTKILVNPPTVMLGRDDADGVALTPEARCVGSAMIAALSPQEWRAVGHGILGDVEVVWR